MSGIAVYSEQLVRELRKLIEVDCYDCANEQAGDASVTFGDFSWTGRISDLANYDAVIYHLGNNPHYHLDIFHIMRQFKGIVVLHDVVLYYLFAGLGRAGLIKHLWLNYGRRGAAEIEEIIGDCADGDILRYKRPENHALTASVFPHASRIIVHNNAARERVISLGYRGAVQVIPLATFPRADICVITENLDALRRKHSIATDDLVIGCLGFIGRTKRIDQVCRALGVLKGEFKFRLIIVGEGDDLTGMIEEAGLAQLTIWTGFVSEREFSNYLGLTDIMVNLRYPSMGESSATLTRAMTLGKPCIVTNDGWFADLPDDTVIKIEIGENEVRDLAAAITKLAGSEDLRVSLGRSAKRFAEETLNPVRIARAFQKVIETDIKDRAQESLLANARTFDSAEAAAQLLRDSLMWRLPGHLKRAFWKPPSGSVENRLSEDHVRWAYRILLNHDPENEEVIEQVRSVVDDVADLRNWIMQSEEYRRKNVASDSGNVIPVKLQPAQHSVLPPDFASGWHDLEGTAEENWRWSSGDAKIALYNSDSIEKRVHLTFGLATIKPRSVKITLGGQRIHQTSLRLGPPQPVDLVLTLAPGANELRFATDVPADSPSDKDSRKLAFMLRDLNISEQRRGNLGNTGEKRSRRRQRRS
jgi:glycosyltransferase involved in cell wall biosynthesis